MSSISNPSSTYKVNVICLTPVRNESWILRQFLAATSIWADYIIIADQMSDDGSREIALNFPKVILVNNNSTSFNEPERQTLLLKEARKIASPRLLITLDSDEFFYPNIQNSVDWHHMLFSKPGTIFKFQMQNLKPDMKYYWDADFFPWGFMDDGSDLHHTEKIHTSRIPISSNNEIKTFKEVKVVHFQFTNWGRMESKHRWYQCFEKINFPRKSSIEIFRRYHHMYAINDSELNVFPNSFLKEYNNLGIDFSLSQIDFMNYFDYQFLSFIQIYSSSKFKSLDIWGKNLAYKSKELGIENIDPRNLFDKSIHFYLRKTQIYFKSKNLLIRILDKLLSHVY